MENEKRQLTAEVLGHVAGIGAFGTVLYGASAVLPTNTNVVLKAVCCFGAGALGSIAYDKAVNAVYRIVLDGVDLEKCFKTK